jgi:hypothetical protein
LERIAKEPKRDMSGVVAGPFLAIGRKTNFLISISNAKTFRGIDPDLFQKKVKKKIGGRTEHAFDVNVIAQEPPNVIFFSVCVCAVFTMMIA